MQIRPTNPNPRALYPPGYESEVTLWPEYWSNLPGFGPGASGKPGPVDFKLARLPPAAVALRQEAREQQARRWQQQAGRWQLRTTRNSKAGPLLAASPWARDGTGPGTRDWPLPRAAGLILVLAPDP